MTPRLKKATKYHGLSMPSNVIEQVKKHIIIMPEYRSVADFAIQSIREKIQRDNVTLLRRFYGDEQINEIMSGNVPFEKFVKDNLGFVIDEKTGELIKIDPSLIKDKKINGTLNEKKLRKIIREELAKK